MTIDRHFGNGARSQPRLAALKRSASEIGRARFLARRNGSFTVDAGQAPSVRIAGCSAETSPNPRGKRFIRPDRYARKSAAKGREITIALRLGCERPHPHLLDDTFLRVFPQIMGRRETRKMTIP